MMADESLEESLVKAIADPGVDIVTDGAEVVLDQLLADGVLREIPVVGTLVKLGKVGLGIRDYLFIRKLARFLVKLRDIPKDERERFVRALSEPGARRQVGETLLLLLDRADDVRKAELLAVAMKWHVRERIDLQTFRELSTAIDRCFVSDLATLGTLGVNPRVQPEVGVRLFSTGLVHQLAAFPLGGPGAFGAWGLTPLGETFLRLLREENHDA
jgi:hypothetical protein